MSRMMQAVEHVKIIRPFVPQSQLSALVDGCRSPEKDFFFAKLQEYAERIQAMPKTYEQDGKGDDALVSLHYFRGGSDFYITEKDTELDQNQAFGLSSLNGGEPELGYISIAELAACNVELDLHFEPRRVREVKGA
ncbi:Protein of unknown function [Humidesulfovibrio mexicanus]|uniref:Uncharacterized protein n=1 Tax=Humidesulfovibrio mexicanus TaxID=147047 RepID=A0A239AWJ5_9BACT|nr:DUF2958 domain-containing protein [Humidesulfovibrio mexicanus]SNR99977.1 Protein of unknown function [Humidesulfovibrio mexicanus]